MTLASNVNIWNKTAYYFDPVKYEQIKDVISACRAVIVEFFLTAFNYAYLWTKLICGYIELLKEEGL